MADGYTCAPNKSPGYKMCVPSIGSEPFYVGIDASDPAKDAEVLSQLFPHEKLYLALLLVHASNPDFPDTARIYNISRFIPQFVKDKLGTSDCLRGPNCYQAAFAASGYDVAGRHVGEDEASFYLSRDFMNTPGCEAMIGSISVYTRGGYSLLPLPHNIWAFAPKGRRDVDLRKCMSFAPGQDVRTEIPAGEHVAWNMGPFKFQKGCYREECGYEIVLAEKAMSSIKFPSDSWDEPAPEELKDGNYKANCYEKVGEDARGHLSHNEELAARARPYLPLFEHYAGLLAAAGTCNWTGFDGVRVDILAQENIHVFLREFYKLLGAEQNVVTALLKIDKGSEVYLRVKSLVDQFAALEYKYDQVKEWGRRTDDRKLEFFKEYYKNHYVHAKSVAFREELSLILSLRGVPEEKWEKVIDTVVEKITAINTEALVRSTSSQGSIDFVKILGDAINSCRARHSATVER